MLLCSSHPNFDLLPTLTPTMMPLILILWSLTRMTRLLPPLPLRRPPHPLSTQLQPPPSTSLSSVHRRHHRLRHVAVSPLLPQMSALTHHQHTRGSIVPIQISVRMERMHS